MKKYLSIFRMQLLNNLAYPAELLWRSMAILLFMLVFTFLWRATYEHSGSVTLAGMSLKDTVWYLMMSETIELARPRFARIIAESVRDGSIAYLLAKPYDFILYQLSASAGESILRVLINTVFGGALVWILVGTPPGPPGWLLAFLAMIGAWLINFIMTTLIGLLAFVTEDIAPFEWIYQKIIFILGGMLIPLDFYPAWLQGIARVLPFSAMMYGPAKLLVSADVQAFASLIATQLVWIITLGGGLMLFYRASIHRLAINGG